MTLSCFDPPRKSVCTQNGVTPNFASWLDQLRESRVLAPNGCEKKVKKNQLKLLHAGWFIDCKKMNCGENSALLEVNKFSSERKAAQVGNEVK